MRACLQNNVFCARKPRIKNGPSPSFQISGTSVFRMKRKKAALPKQAGPIVKGWGSGAPVQAFMLFLMSTNATAPIAITAAIPTPITMYVATFDLFFEASFSMEDASEDTAS